MLSKPARPRLLPALCLLLLAGTLAPSQSVSAAAVWPERWMADSAFYDVWARADEPLAAGAAVRSWLWGPAPFAVANEAYAESASGLRLVEYMDKARMEINDSALDRTSPWFVTGGLLVNEMVMGKVQTGNNSFDTVAPAAIPVAGDEGGHTAPSYAAMSRLTIPAPKQTGQLPGLLAGSDGTTGALPPGRVQFDPGALGYTYFDDVSQHNVPAVFRDWTLQQGTVLESGRRVQGQLMDPTYLLGRPITEAYWVEAPINGKPATVLVQLFERRTLTYNPSNAPEWRVEMGNVGRAYYDWRYGRTPPKPAIAAQTGRSGVTVRGWNWQAGAAVQLKVILPGGVAPVSGPATVTPAPDGSFSTILPSNPQLEGALLSGGNVQAVAESHGATAALPLHGSVQGGHTQIAGVLTQVATSNKTPQLVLATRDGLDWSLTLGSGSALLFSEGTPATFADVHSGAAAAVTGVAAGASIDVAELKLLSVSRTGARLGYTRQAGGKSLRVSGTGWPAGKPVNITLAALNAGGPSALKSVTGDTRGNFSALVPLPASLPAGPLWLFAVAAENDRLLAQVALPYEQTASLHDGPPLLFALTSAGEQQGTLGSYCWRKQCADSTSQPLPVRTMRMSPGEIVGFRSQYGPDPRAGITPDTLSVQIFSRDQPAGQVSEQADGSLLFTPGGQPIFVTGTVPGRPFSVSTPRNLAPGKYVMIVQAGWPDPLGGGAGSTYGFVLEIAQP